MVKFSLNMSQESFLIVPFNFSQGIKNIIISVLFLTYIIQ